MWGAIVGDNRVYTHYARWKTHPNSTIRVWLIPWRLAGISFPPSGSAFSSTSRHAHAPHVTDDGKTWQSCAMPGHPGQSNTPGRRKEVRLKINKFLDKEENIMQPFTTTKIIITTTEKAQRVGFRESMDTFSQGTWWPHCSTQVELEPLDYDMIAHENHIPTVQTHTIGLMNWYIYPGQTHHRQVDIGSL